MIQLPILTSLALCSGLMAQVIATSPTGYVGTAGDSTVSIGVTASFFGSFALQIAQIDATRIGQAQSINTMHLRRSAVAAANPSLTARTMMVTVRMAHGDLAAITGGNQQVDSLLVGNWTTVVQPTALSIPDMSAVPASLPAPWNLSIPLDAPFAYNGTDSLLYQINIWDTVGTPKYPLDAIDQTFVDAQGSAYGTGCSTVNGPFTTTGSIRVFADGSPTQVSFTSTPMLFSNPGGPNFNLMSVGYSMANQSVGFCAPLLNTLDVVLPMQTVITFPSGNAFNALATPITVPHDPVFVGMEFFAQAWGWDGNGTNALIASSGWRTGPYPAPPSNLPNVAMAVIASAPNSAFAGTGIFALGRGVIVGLEP